MGFPKELYNHRYMHDNMTRQEVINLLSYLKGRVLPFSKEGIGLNHDTVVNMINELEIKLKYCNMKTYTIKAPEGMIIDESAIEKGEIKFIPEKPVLPQQWKLEKGKKYWFIRTDSYIQTAGRFSFDSDEEENKNCLPSEELAKAMLALCQLLVMRDRYNDGWKPDWTNGSFDKFIISNISNKIETNVVTCMSKPLIFKTAELRDEFLENFRELIEIAKPLL